jgi:NAD(P)-dependent dehydrogenase (short-subunit alcohol dehydrogenase family)
MAAHETKQIALVTGANKGIGLEISRQLGRKGLVLLIGARDHARGTSAVEQLRAEQIDARLLPLDVTNQASIAAAARWIDGEFGRLDVLINNAGIAIDDGPPSQVSDEIIRRTYETNFFGPVAVMRAMLPLLRKSAAGRIVNLSSSLASLTITTDSTSPFFGLNYLAYNASKTALNVATVSFAKELAGTPIKVNAADPGYTRTDMNKGNGDHDVDEAAIAAVRLATLPPDGPSGTFVDKDGTIAW